MKTKAFFLSLFFLCVTAGISIRAQVNQYAIDDTPDLVDFGILIPFIDLKDSFRGQDISRRLKFTSGVSFFYQPYLSEHFAFGVDTYAWFLPIRFNGRKRTLYSLGGEVGPVYRALPDSYVDPSLSITGGLSRTEGGSGIGGKWNYPVSARIGINLWKETTKFQDSALAFRVSGRVKRYFNELGVMNPTYADVVLAFHGSF